MMKKIILMAISLIPLLSCSQQISPARDFTNAVLWQQGSGEYRALAFQAYNYARLSLKEALWEQANSRPNCVIVDVDETVLDNSAFQGQQIKKGISYDPVDWTKWTSLAAADTVPGALSFLKFAASKGVETFYVTNRDQADYAATLKNLKKIRISKCRRKASIG